MDMGENNTGLNEWSSVLCVGSESAAIANRYGIATLCGHAGAKEVDMHGSSEQLMDSMGVQAARHGCRTPVQKAHILARHEVSE